MNHIYKVIYDISVDLVTFERSNQGRRPFKGLFLINGTSYDQSLYEIDIISHTILYEMPWVAFKGQIKVIGVHSTSLGYVS